MSDLPYVVAFSHLLEIGPVKFNQLVALCGSAKAAWQSLPQAVNRLGWVGETGQKILSRYATINPDREFDRCQKMGVKLLTTGDPQYPRLLKEIADPPFLLYVRGELKPSDDLALAVVGTRRVSPYGLQVVENLIPPLAQSGLTIVSGLAFGVDYKVTATAFEAGGRVVSVVASGVDKLTPYSNASLAQKILKAGRGAVVSEFPLGVEPQPFYFPRRNRIISGLALGVLVVEAAAKSGALITAKSALEQGREVFAVPGSIFSLVSAGTHGLLKEGAKLVTSADDVTLELGLERKVQSLEARENLPGNDVEAELLESLGLGLEVLIDEIIPRSRFAREEVLAALTLLELKGLVKNIGGGYYRIDK